MASFHYNTAANKVYDASLDMLVDVIKVGLSTSTHVPIRDDDFLDEVGADDFIDGELSGTGYTAGFGGAGLLTLASKTIIVDKPNDRSEFDAARHGGTRASSRATRCGGHAARSCRGDATQCDGWRSRGSQPHRRVAAGPTQ